jgi:hypothetical protein
MITKKVQNENKQWSARYRTKNKIMGITNHNKKNVVNSVVSER